MVAILYININDALISSIPRKQLLKDRQNIINFPNKLHILIKYLEKKRYFQIDIKLDIELKIYDIVL